MKDDLIDVANTISNVVRAVGAMSGELVFFFILLIFLFLICIDWVY